MASPQKKQALSILAGLLFFAVPATSLDIAELINVVQTPDGLELAASSPLPPPTPGPSSVCLGRAAFYPVTPNWSVSVTMTPTTWKSSGTLASATNQWSLQTSDSTLRLVVPRSPEGKSGYNHQWMLGVQGRLVNATHTITLSTTASNGHTETRVFLDGELRARLQDELLTYNPGTTGKLCAGTTWPMQDVAVRVQNQSWKPTQYNSPNPYTIYPGLASLASLPVTPGIPVTITSTVTEPSAGTKVYLEPRWQLSTGQTLSPKKVASLLIMACGVGGTKKNQSFMETGAAKFHDANQTFTCVISDASFNKTNTDTLNAWGEDVGLEYNINNCAGLGVARQTWLLNRGYSAESFVNYYGITTETGIACTQRYGFTFLNGPGTDNPLWFRATMRHANCDYKTDVLKCYADALKDGVRRDRWTVISGHWTGRYYNDSLWTDLLYEAGRLGITFKSVADIQHTAFPALGHDPITLTPPPDAEALIPALQFYSDGTQSPALTDINITT